MLVALALVALQVRTVELPAELARHIRVECPVGTVTRIVFPEPLLTLRWSKGTREAVGARLRSTEPVGIVELEPARLASPGSLEARGPSRTLTIELTVVPKGGPLEVRLVLNHANGEAPETGAASDGAGATRSGSLGSVEGAVAKNNKATGGVDPPQPLSGEPSSSGPATKAPEAASDQAVQAEPRATGVRLAAVPPAAASKVDLTGLLAAEVVPIGRRELQPGRHEVVLVDALHGRDWVWLRFVVRGGAGEPVEGVRSEQGPVASYQAEASGEDLRIVVQVPRALVKSKSKVTLHVAGGEYRFPLNSGTLGAFLKGLFQ